MKRPFVFLASLLFFDVFSKYLTYWYVPKMRWMHSAYPYGGYGVFEGFFGGISLSINHVQNKGAAWGLFSQYSDQLFFIRLLVVLALLVYLFLFVKNSFSQMLFLCIIAGALGNILDYFVYGSVIDMIHMNFWGYTFPLFNFADICITVGIVSLFLLSFLRKDSYRASY